VSSSITDPHALRLLRSLIYEDVSVLTPRIGQDIYYPKVEEVAHINREKTDDLLSDLWKQGYLQRKFYGNVFRCPHDGTTSLRPRLLCPSCNSEEIERVNMIEHLKCGHVDIEKNFLKDGEYVCPKDGKKLHQIGVDYTKPGPAYYCPHCDEKHPEPLERWTCNSSDHSFSLEEAVEEKIFEYVLNEDKREEALHVFELIQPIGDVFKKFGFKIETFHKVKGSSGISHLVDIYAYREGKPFMAIAGVLVQEGIKPEEVLKISAISMDIHATKTLLIAVPSLDQVSAVYAKNLGLSVVEAKDIETVNQRLTPILKEWT